MPSMKVFLAKRIIEMIMDMDKRAKLGKSMDDFYWSTVALNFKYFASNGGKLEDLGEFANRARELLSENTFRGKLKTI